MQTPKPKLCVEWIDRDRAIDDALRELPGTEEWPGLFDMLLARRGRNDKVALVSQQTSPVGLVLLRQTGYGTWEPSTQWIVPGFLFPVCLGYTGSVLAALQLRIDVAWWRYSEGPPEGTRFQDWKEKTRHGMACGADFEAYWKTSGNLSFVRSARKKCKDFVLKQNPEGGAEWAIRNAEMKWRFDETTALPGLEDRVAAARHLEQLGLLNTFVLYDRDTPVAANSFLIHQECVVGQTMFRLPEYDRCGVGTYLMESVFRWAKEAGIKEVDVGGGYAYKDRWAPANGKTFSFTVVPTMDMVKTKLRRATRSILSTSFRWLK